MINVTDEILVTGYFSKFFLAGIEEARLLFGDKGAEAARQHIISDLKMEGCASLYCAFHGTSDAPATSCLTGKRAIPFREMNLIT